MNCRSFRKRQVELLDACPDPATIADLLEHIAECSKCAQELREAQTVMARITPSQKLRDSSKVKERIMNSITDLNTTQQTDAYRRPGYRKLVHVGIFAAFLLLAIVATGRFTSRNGSISSPVYVTLAQASEFVRGVKTMHISARMRTIPQGHFDCIDLNAPLIPVEMWTQFGDLAMVRIQKQHRKIVADGKSTTMLMQTGGTPLAAKFDGLAEGCFSTLAPLLHPDTLFERESKAAESSDSDVNVATEFGSDGREKTILTISAKAQGDFSESDYLRNKSIIESYNIRIYTFDAQTSRCEGVQVYIRTGHGNVLVFETTKIEYDIPLDPSLFRLNVPKSATWLNESNETEVVRDTSSMQPDEFAQEFFDTLSRSDWQKARQFSESLLDNSDLRKMFGGLKIISIGKPFRSGLYPGWFVPYEIQLKSGQVRKHNLAIRNDNPKRQWIWDGGL
ncbi:MAG: hypothetical protein ABFD54_16880 [Armatimonadota bacterium]|nr:hypothetical protein [bacterium]